MNHLKCNNEYPFPSKKVNIQKLATVKQKYRGYIMKIEKTGKKVETELEKAFNEAMDSKETRHSKGIIHRVKETLA